MKITKKDFLKFSKQEIVDAIFQKFQWYEDRGNNISDLHFNIRQSHFVKLQKESDALFKKHNEASAVNLEFTKMMLEKYAPETKQLPISVLNTSEIAKMIMLSNKTKKTWDKYRAKQREIDKYFEEWHQKYKKEEVQEEEDD